MAKKNQGFMVYVTLLAMGIFYAVIYSVPYIKSIFYDGMIALTGATNAQLGLTMTIYGIGEVLSPGIGGFLSERFDYKKIILISPMFTAVGCIILALKPSFTMTIIVWIVLVFSTLFMLWGSIFKAIRLLASEENQGKITGLFYGANGVGYVIVNFVGIYIYDLYAKTNPAKGMQSVFILFGVLTVVTSIIAYICLRNTEIFEEEDVDSDKKEESIFKQFKEVAKHKGVWFFGGAMCCIYSTNISLQYFTPYFSDVLGVTVVFGGIIAIIRQYGIRILGSPAGGYLGDKIGSLAKVLIGCFIGCIAIIAAILVLPASLKTVTILTILLLVLALFNNVGMGTQYALISEAKVPREYTAAAIGMGTMLGFSPDVYLHVVFGKVLDVYGNDGYTFIFMYGAVACVIGVFLLSRMLKFKSTMEVEEA